MTYCQMALEYVREAKEKDNLLFGLVYMLSGKVLYAKAEHAENGSEKSSSWRMRSSSLSKRKSTLS